MYDQTEMYEQTEAFPKTRREFAEEFLSHFQADVEAAEKSLVNAQVKLAAARRIRDDGEENLRLAIRAEEGIVSEPVVEGDAAVLDPITGEVVSHTSGDEKREVLPPTVFVFWPDEDSLVDRPVQTEVGDRTTYGELVADYLEATEPGEPIEDFMVVRVEGGLECNLNTRIVEFDYGVQFRIERKVSHVDLAEHEALKAQESAA